MRKKICGNVMPDARFWWLLSERKAIYFYRYFFGDRIEPCRVYPLEHIANICLSISIYCTTLGGTMSIRAFVLESVRRLLDDDLSRQTR